jgi:molybdopterin-guanine dinucleotide biosynthesis protein A
MRCAGILLTGGASTRFGRDKATTPFGDSTLAERAARALRAATEPTIEVGPGVSGLASVTDARRGPLVALAAGLAALADPSAVLLLACDLPLVDEAILWWLAQHPAAGSVVPLAGDPPLPQPLCARWSAGALAAVPGLVDAGERSLRPLVAGSDVTFIAPAEWQAVAGSTDVLDDADTPDELERLRSRLGDDGP